MVSLVLPVRNEERFIRPCLDSILSQDYPGEMEVLVVDGRSMDKTREMAEAVFKKDGLLPNRSFRLLDNPEKHKCPGLNKAIPESKGEVTVIIDAHAFYAADYVSKCIEVLGETGAANVGGAMRARPPRDTAVAKAIALAHHSWFGLGGAKFHEEEAEGETYTIWMGAFPKRVFAEVGGFDVRYPRTEDIVFNRKLRELGHKLWISPKIRAWYFCRGTLRELWKQNWANGRGVIDTLPMNRRAIGLRHLVPLLFVLSILGLIILHFALCILHFPGSHAPQLLSPSAPLLLLAAELGLYILLSLCFSFRAVWSSPNVLTSQLPNLAVKDSVGSSAPQPLSPSAPQPPGSSASGQFALCTLHFALCNAVRLFLCLPAVFLTLHLSYGLGSLVRLIQVPFVRRMWKSG